jgi:hypothetical protein
MTRRLDATIDPKLRVRVGSGGNSTLTLSSETAYSAGFVRSGGPCKNPGVSVERRTEKFLARLTSTTYANEDI